MIARFSFVLILSSMPAWHLAAAENTKVPSPSGPVLLEIDGVKLTLSDVERKSTGTMFQARNAFYQAERKAVDEFIDGYVVERQAEKEHLTVPQLLEKHVDSSLPPDPSEEGLKVYFEGLNTTEPFEKVRPQILDHLRQIRRDKLKTAYVKDLRSKASISTHFPVARIGIPLNDTPVRGASNAPLMLIEYADYECPYCQQIEPVLTKLEAEYKDKLAFAYKDAPLPNHAHAAKAAEAARCAGAQGKYWEYHDKIFATKQLDLPELKEHARALSLDTKAFDACLESGQNTGIVKAQLTEAMEKYQVQGTPSFFLNGRFFSGVLNYEQMKALIEEEIGVAQGATP